LKIKYITFQELVHTFLLLNLKFEYTVHWMRNEVTVHAQLKPTSLQNEWYVDD